jgi:DNA-binding NtrC family response regulator
MRRQQVLVFDFASVSCPAGDCQRLPDLIRATWPQTKIQTETNPFTCSQFSVRPSLAILRFYIDDFSPPILRSVRQQLSDTPLLGILCSREKYRAEGFALEELDDFLCCPFSELELIARIRRLVPWSENTCTPKSPHALAMKERFHLESLVGDSACFLRVIEKIPRVAQSDATVLITGETGTGKELFARAVHYSSSRQARPFIPVNCGALPDHLFENEFFGHIKGAFTDASSSEEGLLALASGGSLFLDEIDALSLSAQVKLLRFLQDHEYRPLGSSKTKLADVRIIAASNADLKSKLTAGLFREDLYHRLHVLILSIPPLRERTEDIPFLAKHFLAKYGSQNALGSIHLAPGALRKLVSYQWPGNVRELESLIQRLTVFTSAPILQAADIDLPSISESVNSEHTCLRDAKNRAIEECEFAYLTRVLALHHGNVSRAAKTAGKERRAFQRLLRKHGLDRRPFLGTSGLASC